MLWCRVAVLHNFNILATSHHNFCSCLMWSLRTDYHAAKAQLCRVAFWANNQAVAAQEKPGSQQIRHTRGPTMLGMLLSNTVYTTTLYHHHHHHLGHHVLTLYTTGEAAHQEDLGQHEGAALPGHDPDQLQAAGDQDTDIVWDSGVGYRHSDLKYYITCRICSSNKVFVATR